MMGYIIEILNKFVIIEIKKRLSIVCIINVKFCWDYKVCFEKEIRNI